jgi:hypothetical protein
LLALGLTKSIRRVRQKRNVTCALDSGRQQPLMLGAIAGHSTWYDFAALQHKPAQQLVVLVVNRCDLVFTQTAWFPSSSIKSFSHDSLFSRNSISNPDESRQRRDHQRDVTNLCFFLRSASIHRLGGRNNNLSRGSSQGFGLLTAPFQINLGNNRQKTNYPFVELESIFDQRRISFRRSNLRGCVPPLSAAVTSR